MYVYKLLDTSSMISLLEVWRSYQMFSPLVFLCVFPMKNWHEFSLDDFGQRLFNIYWSFPTMIFWTKNSGSVKMFFRVSFCRDFPNKNWYDFLFGCFCPKTSLNPLGFLPIFFWMKSSNSSKMFFWELYTGDFPIKIGMSDFSLDDILSNLE